MSRMYDALRNAQQSGVATDIPAFGIHEVADLPIESPSGPDTGNDLLTHGKSQPEPLPEKASSFTASPQMVNDRNSFRCLPIHALDKAAVIRWDASGIPGAAQYRIIRTRIVQHRARPKVMVVSGACSGDGKTVSAINIAGVMSLREGTNILLMDADLRRTGLTCALGLPAGPGLSDVLSRSCTLQEALIRVEQFPNLYVLTAGTARDSAAELLDSEQWKSLCATVRQHFGFVIIDAPPVASVADYELIQAACDGVIMVVRPGHTDRTLFTRALELIPESKKLGVILNDNPKWFLWKTHDSYYEYT